MLAGSGLVVYAAALVLVPSDGEVPATPTSTRDRYLVAGVAIVAVIVGTSIGVFGGFGVDGAIVPLGFLALAGLAVYWIASGRRPSGGTPADIARRALFGVVLLAACFALAVGSFVASGLGGGVVVAGLVIAAGAALVAAAFVGGARWLILPALAIALPLAFVSAAGVDLEGGFGERTERPATLAEVHSSYRIGAGELVIDLRDVALPPGDHRLKVGIGAGHALVLVPDDVCVASSASIGVGGVAVFDRDGGGIDVKWNDGRRAPANTPRLVLDGDVGAGFLEERPRPDPRGPLPRRAQRRLQDHDGLDRHQRCAAGLSPTRSRSRRASCSSCSGPCCCWTAPARSGWTSAPWPRSRSA
jgi:hypothetical protein